MKIYYNPKLKPLARYLHTHSTYAEILLWNELKARKMLDYQFMRQKPIGDYIVDFYCSKLRLAIEVDGDSHKGRLNKDHKKDQRLSKMGIKVIRITNDDIFDDMESVLNMLVQWIEESGY